MCCEAHYYCGWLEFNPVGKWCKTQLRFTPPERQGSWDIYVSSSLQFQLRAVPRGANSSLLSSQEGKKMQLLIDGNSPRAHWSGKTQGIWVNSLWASATKATKGKHCRRKQDRSVGLHISKSLTINQSFPSMPSTRNHWRLVKIQIYESHPRLLNQILQRKILGSLCMVNNTQSPSVSLQRWLSHLANLGNIAKQII